MKRLVAQLCLTLGDSIDPPGSSTMGFPRQEYWSGLPCLSPGDLPDPGIEPGSPALLADSLLSESPGKATFNQLYPPKYCDIHPLKEYTLYVRNYSCYYEGYKYKICNACLRKAWWWKLTRIILVYLTLLNPRLEHVFNFGHYQKVEVFSTFPLTVERSFTNKIKTLMSILISVATRNFQVRSFFNLKILLF